MDNFFDKIVAWQLKYGRKNLPWQQARDPYKIWLSEVMLQQTQVQTVIDYYHRFLQRFPTVHALAQAPIDEVLVLWAGLGYYARARNLHACAQMVVTEYGGVFPAKVELLERLPGIGKTTASAIAAFAYGAPVSILDAHVKRILRRVYGKEVTLHTTSTGRLEKKLWQIANGLVKTTASHEEMIAYTQGLMDLGSLVCSPNLKYIRCGECPVQVGCQFKSNPTIENSPKKSPKPTVERRLLLIYEQQKIYLEQRPPKGIWGGLYSLKETNQEDFQMELIHSDLRLIAPDPIFKFKHAFTHYHLVADIYLCAGNYSAKQGGANFFKLEELDLLALPAPIKKMFASPVLRSVLSKYI